MSSVSWIVTTTPQVSGLVETARATGWPVEAVVVGDRRTADAVAASGVDGVHWIEVAGATPAEAAATTVAALAEERSPRLVVAGTSGPAKALAGAVAARLGAEVLTGVTSVERAEDAVAVTRSVFGGIVDAEEVWASPVVVLVEAGSAPEAAGAPAEVRPVAVEALGLSSVEQRVAAQEHVDLTAARRIVAAGRGVKAREDLALVDDLAAALGAEVGCSRPLAEGVDWFEKDRYIGVSGAHVAPDLYVAVGISGQLQHMSGAREAGTVVAINTDKDAPVFAQADFGVVGDLYEVLPALTATLRG